MATNYVQNDTAATFNVGCSGATAGLTTAARQAQEDGSAGSGADTVSPDSGLGDALRACFAWDCLNAPGLSSWASGTWTVPVVITNCDAGTILREVHVCDFDGTSTYTSVASNTSPGHTRGNNGTVNVSVTQSSDHTPQSEANSRPFIVLVFSNNDDHGGAAVDVTSSQTIVAPYTISNDASVESSDTASWAESAVLTFENQTDTASWTETEDAPATLTGTDTAAWSDRRTVQGVPADHASGWAEAEDLNTGGDATPSSSDTASWAEAASITASTTSSDTAPWADDETEVVNSTDAETASWNASTAETVSTSRSDTGAWAETETLATGANPTSSDTATWADRRTELRRPIDGSSSWTESESLSAGGDASPTSSDTAAWDETTTETATAAPADTTAWTVATAETFSPARTDTGGTAETQTPAAAYGATDTGGTDESPDPAATLATSDTARWAESTSLDTGSADQQFTEVDSNAWIEALLEAVSLGARTDTGAWTEATSLDTGSDQDVSDTDTAGWDDATLYRNTRLKDRGIASSTINLANHTVDIPALSWEYGATFNHWQIEGAVGIASNNTSAIFARTNSDVIPANGGFTIYADHNQAAIDNIAWGGGVHFFCDLVGAASSSTPTGVRVAIVRGATPNSPNIVVERFDDSGVSQESFTVVTGLAGWSVGDAIRLGCDVAANNVDLTIWTEPFGGGTRTQRGTVTLTADIRDANHRRVGLYGGAGGTSGRNFTTNVYLVDPVHVRQAATLAPAETASWAEVVVALSIERTIAAADTASWMESATLPTFTGKVSGTASISARLAATATIGVP